MRALLSVLALVALTACEFDRTTIPTGQTRPVVHAVLNPGEAEQVILVERTLTGTVDVDGSVPFDADDPIVTGSGVPVSGAIVEVFDELGARAVAAEDATTRPDGKGAGVYRFLNQRAPIPGPGDPIPPPIYLIIGRGREYTLRVTTPEGHVVTGRTHVPDTYPAVDSAARSFDRDHDTLRLTWRAVPDAKRYVLRVDSPFGPFFLFAEETSLQLPGRMQNLFANDFPRVFIPGFRQRVVLGAVDVNFFDYYRSRNDEFRGAGLINHLEGGTGVFGAFVTLETRTLEVTAPIDEPIEGTYRATQPATVDVLRLWVNEQLDDAVQISGNLTTVGGRVGLIGTLRGSELELATYEADGTILAQPPIAARVRGDQIDFLNPDGSVRATFTRSAGGS